MSPEQLLRCLFPSLLLPSILLCVISAGCMEKKLAGQSLVVGPPEVSIAVPVEREIIESVEYTGLTEAVESVEVRARVSGYMTKVLFKDGMEVKQGDPLFEIDPRPYQAEVDRIQGELDAAHARLKRLEAELTRAEELLKKKINTPEDYEKAVADRDETVAGIASREASLQKAKLDLSFCSISSPIAGRVSRELVSQGNLVNADSTLLTDIVSVDPIYLYFDMDELTLLRLKKMVREKTLKSLDEAEPLLELGLADEEGYPHQGVIDFAENRLSAGTGTIRVRGRFPNPNRTLIPGLFARVRLPLGSPHPVLMVPERAIGSDQQRRFLLIVGAEDKVESRTVTLGTLEGHLRVITSGLKPGERVIINGLQRARSGATVKPMTVDAVTLSDIPDAGNVTEKEKTPEKESPSEKADHP